MLRFIVGMTEENFYDVLKELPDFRWGYPKIIYVCVYSAYCTCSCAVYSYPPMLSIDYPINVWVAEDSEAHTSETWLLWMDRPSSHKIHQSDHTNLLWMKPPTPTPLGILGEASGVERWQEGSLSLSSFVDMRKRRYVDSLCSIFIEWLICEPTVAWLPEAAGRGATFPPHKQVAADWPGLTYLSLPSLFLSIIFH